MALGAIWADGLWDEAIWDNPIWAQNEAPTLSRAQISFAGTTITLTFSKAVTFGAGGNGGWALSLSGGACAMSYSSGDGGTELVYSLSRTVSASETGTIAYTQPGDGVEGTIIADDLATFSGTAVSVGSEKAHNRQMRHTSVTLGHMATTLEHNDPTIEHNE
jgi:hypothetical protein